MRRVLLLTAACAVTLAGCGGSGGGSAGGVGGAPTTAAARSTTSPGPAAQRTSPPSTGTTPAAAGPGCLAAHSCLTPEELRAAYGVAPLTARGIDGRGETILLPEEGASRAGPKVSPIQTDLALFDRRFGLPPAQLTVISRAPGAQPALGTDEEALDTEIIHAIAPGAALVVVLVPGNPAVGVPAALNAAETRYAGSAAVISVSAGISERCTPPAVRATTQRALVLAARVHVSVVVSSGDSGPLANPCDGRQSLQPTVGFPQSDPLALSVGGTRLATGPGGVYRGETVWNANALGTETGPHLGAGGGGSSLLFARPAYQRGVPGIGARRATPDVAADAAGQGGIARTTYPGGRVETVGGGGTSASAPLWAGVLALADQDAGHHLGFVNAAIYRIAASASGARAFHDITQGNNTVKVDGRTIQGGSAGPGWDPVTGWGSPDAAVLVPLLARAG